MWRDAHGFVFTHMLVRISPGPFHTHSHIQHCLRPRKFSESPPLYPTSPFNKERVGFEPGVRSRHVSLQVNK